MWWHHPSWQETLCMKCGRKIWPEGDPDWGYCYEHFTEIIEQRELQKKQEEKERDYWEKQEWAYHASPWFDPNHPMNKK